MNPETLHDALTQLPSDLIAETDAKRRSSQRKAIPFRRYAAMAACLAVVLFGSILAAGNGLGGTGKGDAAMQKTESAVWEEANDILLQEAAEEIPEEAPAEAAPALKEIQPPVDFSIRLFQASLKETENTLVSPLSVLTALGMTANGADGDTLTQMEAALGLTTQELNDYLYMRLDSGTQQLKLANAIWLREDPNLTVNQDFLDASNAYYRAEVETAVFDQSALSAINSWVDEKTEGMIPKLLDRLSENAVMYLVNALAFDAEWETPYEAYQVQEADFTTEDGRKRTVEMMYSKEGYYLEDEQATGFMKHYAGGRYAFVALLPREGIRIRDYAASLTADGLRQMLKNAEESTVHTALPKFQTEFDGELSEILKHMGIQDAFTETAADFSRLGSYEDGNIYISRVLHKTFLSVAEEGTRAGAATAVEMVAGSAFQPDPKIVTLDRPFVYMLIDCEDHSPFFIGALMDPEAVPDMAAEAVPELPAPPRMTALEGENSLSLTSGSYTWTVDNNTVIACGPAPLDNPEAVPVIAAQRNVRLVWSADGEEYPPDAIEAVGWNPETGECKPLRMDGNSLFPEHGYPVIEINATWKNFGNACYLFGIAANG